MAGGLFMIRLLTCGDTTLRSAGDNVGILMGSQFKLSEITNASEPAYKATHTAQYALSEVC
jgi:hypothetical protein